MYKNKYQNNYNNLVVLIIIINLMRKMIYMIMIKTKITINCFNNFNNDFLIIIFIFELNLFI